MAPEEGRNVRNKLITITLAVIFMIKSELWKQILFLKLTQFWMTSKTLKYDKYCKMGVIFSV